MINKYQAGGATQGSILQEIAKLPQDQQKKIMTAFGKWAQAKGLNIQQLQGNEQALEQAMGQFLQEIQASQAPKARLGAKLNYIRNLKGNAPEGMVVEYYKCGGQTKKRFVKAAGGEKVKDGKKEIDDFKKKACGGRKFQPGGKAPEKKKEEWTQKDDKKLLKYRLKGTSTPAEKKDSTDLQTKWNNLPEKVKAKHEVKEKCGGKVKKHQQGGSLNSVPFYQAGTSKGGITWGIHKPQMDSYGREVTTMESAPDNFGRNVQMSRIVTPRRDGTFRNDTTYGVRFMSGNNIDASSYDTSGKQYGLSPKSSIGKPFNKWGDYFKHVMSLKKPKAPQAPKASTPPYNHYLSMVM